MLTTNFTEFRKRLKSYLDHLEQENETLIIKRGKGKSVVLFSLNEYNSIAETAHLLNSKKNAERLRESIEQMKSGKIIHLKNFLLT
jgi:antitoxin YefM